MLPGIAYSRDAMYCVRGVALYTGRPAACPWLPPLPPPLLPPLLPAHCCLNELSPLPLLLMQCDCLSPLWKLLAPAPCGAVEAVEAVLSLT